jgi:hypothetical protein
MSHDIKSGFAELMTIVIHSGFNDQYYGLYLFSFDMMVMHVSGEEITTPLMIITSHVVMEACTTRGCKAWYTR